MAQQAHHSRSLTIFGEPILILIAFWPILSWLVQRVADKSDEPWGLLALGTVALFLFADKSAARQPKAKLGFLVSLLPILALGCYLSTYCWAPHLVQSTFFMCALGFYCLRICNVPSSTGCLGLLGLSLPLTSSLNFFCGYPLRYIVTSAAVALLNGCGFVFVQNGTLITIAGRTISIDAPCSGISMLWVGIYTCFVLCCFFRMPAVRAAIFVAVSSVSLIVSNVMRIIMLLLFDWLVHSPGAADLSLWEPTVHVGAGLLTFLIALSQMFVFAYAMQRFVEGERMAAGRRRSEDMAIGSRSEDIECSGENTKRSQPRLFVLSRAVCFCALAMACALIPFVAKPVTSAQLALTEPVWPTTVAGNNVTAVDCFEEERTFAGDFPGKMKRFTDGDSSYFVRYVQHETRQLHSSADCFKGMGYIVTPGNILIANDGSKWSSFTAETQSSKYIVRERIYDESGNAWTDVSEWYWDAALSRSHGPWWAVTMATRK